MPSDILIFQRVEKKYLLTEESYRRLREKLRDRLSHDIYGKSTIGSLYLDTPDFRLIRNSIDAKEYELKYKEKLRLRSYGTPTENTRVFLEIKKKYRGIVYKRRVAMKLSDAMRYLKTGEKNVDGQIMKEIDYAMRIYENPKPACAVFYEREAFYDKEFPSLRLTFDRNVRYRTDDLDLTKGTHGTSILSPDAVLMEIKTAGAMPLFLVNTLNELKIYPSSFSKYGTAFADITKQKAEIQKGEFIYV